jgi:hypothetical protein
MTRACKALLLRSLLIPTLGKVSARSLHMKRIVPHLLLIVAYSYSVSSNHIPLLGITHRTCTKEITVDPC